MERGYETRIVGAETIQQNDILRRQLGIRAYQIASTEHSTQLSRQFAAFDIALIHEAQDAVPHHVIGQLELPIEIRE